MDPQSLDTLLHDQDPDARYGSARALGQIYVEKEIKTLVKARTVRALTEALTDPEPAVRFWAAEALGKCKSQTAIEPLGELLRDSHEGVRQQAVLSLEKIGGEAAQAMLQRGQARGFLKWLRGD